MKNHNKCSAFEIALEIAACAQSEVQVCLEVCAEARCGGEECSRRLGVGAEYPERGAQLSGSWFLVHPEMESMDSDGNCMIKWRTRIDYLTI